MTERRVPDSGEQDNAAGPLEHSADSGQSRVLGRVKLTKRRVAATDQGVGATTPSQLPAEIGCEIWHARAIDALASGHPDEALECCHQARKIEPDRVAYAATEVWIRAHLSRPDLKVRELELSMLIVDHATCVSARYYRGIIRGRLGDDVGARRDFEHVLGVAPDHAGARAGIELRGSSRRRSSHR
jgi:hypothetical protein